jgi:hypothetical protein
LLLTSWLSGRTARHAAAAPAATAGAQHVYAAAEAELAYRITGAAPFRDRGRALLRPLKHGSGVYTLVPAGESAGGQPGAGGPSVVATTIAA